jgi:hypothetical protein
MPDMPAVKWPWEQAPATPAEHKPIVIGGKPQPADVPTQLLNIDYTYQAMVPRNPRLIKQIGRNFEWEEFGRLRVARRANGALFVFDGRHRLEGARLANIATVPCDIYDVPDRKREIELFLACNTKIRKVPQGMLFMAEVAAGDTDAVALNRLVQDAGLAIVDSNTAKQEFAVPKLACIAALKSLYGHGSQSYAKRATAVTKDELYDALQIIGDVAPPNALVTEHATLGFVWVLTHYPALRKQGDRLQKIGWPRLDMACRAVGPRPKAEDAGKALLSVIDFRRKASDRLAPNEELPPPPDWLPAMAA